MLIKEIKGVGCGSGHLKALASLVENESNWRNVNATVFPSPARTAGESRTSGFFTRNCRRYSGIVMRWGNLSSTPFNTLFDFPGSSLKRK